MSPPALCHRCGDLRGADVPWIPELGWCAPCFERLDPDDKTLVPPARTVWLQLLVLVGLWTVNTLGGALVGAVVALGLGQSGERLTLILVLGGVSGFILGTFLLPILIHRRLNQWGYRCWLDAAIARLDIDPEAAARGGAMLVRWRSDLRGYGRLLRPSFISLMLRSPESLTLISAHGPPLRVTRETLARIRPHRAPLRRICNGFELGLTDGRLCEVHLTYAPSLAEADRLVDELITAFPVATPPISAWSRSWGPPPIEPPVEPPIEPPIELPIELPIEPPIEPPVEPTAAEPDA